MSKNKLLKITEEGKFNFSNIDFDEVQKLDCIAFADFLNELCTEAFLTGLGDAATFDFSNVDFTEAQKLDWYAFGDFLNELCKKAFLTGLDDAVTIKESEG